MRPLDPRLLRWARSTQRFLLGSVAISVIHAGVVIAQAWLISRVVVALFLEGVTPAAVSTELVALAAVAGARGALVGALETTAGVTGTQAKRDLRAAVVETVMGAPEHRPHAGMDITVLATRGIDALDAYFSRYLPQLVLAAVVPLIVGITILTRDLLSAVIIGVTLPLIPVFMILIGWYTQSRVDRQWASLGVLSHHFLDVVSGWTTLAIFGRARAQVESLRRINADYRRSTMQVLRISFISAFALELLSTISVAMVAVGIGLRLVDGQMDLRTGLFILILAPEAYLPVRMVGVHFHAAAEGLGAAGRILDLLEQAPTRMTRSTTQYNPRGSIQLTDVRVGYADHTVLEGCTATLTSGRVTAITGPSGCGKTTLVQAILGLHPLAAGRITIDGVDVAGIPRALWFGRIGYVGQRPVLSFGTLRDALAPPGEHSDADLIAALARSGLPIDVLPAGLDTHVGQSGLALSVGQRRRVAIARALLRDPDLIVMDEPTAALDGLSEAEVVATLAYVRERGVTVIVVAHRGAVIEAADEVLDLSAWAAVPS